MSLGGGQSIQLNLTTDQEQKSPRRRDKENNKILHQHQSSE
jgi:hypothetical protein